MLAPFIITSIRNFGYLKMTEVIHSKVLEFKIEKSISINVLNSELAKSLHKSINNKIDLFYNVNKEKESKLLLKIIIERNKFYMLKHRNFSYKIISKCIKSKYESK